MQLAASFATALSRAASGNNNRLSTLWREVISLAGVARSLSKVSSYRNFPCRYRHAEHVTSLRRRLEMSTNAAIEDAVPLVGGIRDDTSTSAASAVLPDTTA